MNTIKQLGMGGIHHRLKRLSDRLQNDILKVYKKSIPGIEPAWVPLLFSLKENANLSVREIADSMGISHPAVVQLLQKIEHNDLVKFRQDSIDRRRKLIELTKLGEETIEKIGLVQKDIEDSYLSLINESGLDIPIFLDKIESALDRTGFYKRINNTHKERALKEVEIVLYNKKYRNLFRELNYEWLNKYFEIEPADENILNNPEKEIIKKGGQIFFARIDGEIVGTCAAIKVDNETYELAKMAVTARARGKQAGKKLALAVIGYTWSQKAKYLVLDTNSKLVAAVNLYKSLGFETMPDAGNSKYKRRVFRMMLQL